MTHTTMYDAVARALDAEAMVPDTFTKLEVAEATICTLVAAVRYYAEQPTVDVPAMQAHFRQLLLAVGVTDTPTDADA